MKLTIDQDRARLEARPTPRLLAVLPRLEGHRMWTKDGKLSLVNSRHNVDVLREALPALVVEGHENGHSLAEEFSAPLAAYEPRTQPYDHQAVALAKARQCSAFALFMEQGTGKTWVAITRAGELWAAGKITGVLVLAKKGVHRQWLMTQVPEHYGADWGGRYFESGKLVTVQEGAGLQWMAINFDGAKTPKGKQACLDFIEAHKGKLLLIGDETQEIKNARSARHKAAEFLKRASGSPFRMALTGTPIAKDLTDEWAQLKWLDPAILGIQYVTTFRAEYCIMGGFEGRSVVGHKNMDRFRETVDPYSFRATKDELGLLPKAYRRWKVELSPEQKDAITALRQDLKHQIETGEVTSASTAAVALVKIQQASNGFLIDDDRVFHELVPAKRNPRLNALLEILDAYDGQTIVWARFRKDIELIAVALKGAGISTVEYHGGTSDRDRSAAVDNFLSGCARVFLSNPQAGGTGLNLQSGGCLHAIYYSNSFNAIDRWQSEDRIHRIGTVGQVVYTDLVARGSIDSLILSNLKRKKGISDMALGDIYAFIEEAEE